MTKLKWGSEPGRDAAYGDVVDCGRRLTLHYYTSTEDGWTTAWVLTVGKRRECPSTLGDYRSPDEARRACEEHYAETRELCD